jgi:hypothetical protein
MLGAKTEAETAGVGGGDFTQSLSHNTEWHLRICISLRSKTILLVIAIIKAVTLMESIYIYLQFIFLFFQFSSHNK